MVKKKLLIILGILLLLTGCGVFKKNQIKPENKFVSFDLRVENLSEYDIENSKYLFNLWYKKTHQEASRYVTTYEFSTTNHKPFNMCGDMTLKLDKQTYVELDFKLKIKTINTEISDNIEQYLLTDKFQQQLYIIVKNVCHECFMIERDIKILNEIITLYVYHTIKNKFLNDFTEGKVDIIDYTKEPLKVHNVLSK